MRYKAKANAQNRDLFSAQDDAQNINLANYKNINFAFCILNFAFIKSPSLKVLERIGVWGKEKFFQEFFLPPHIILPANYS